LKREEGGLQVGFRVKSIGIEDIGIDDGSQHADGPVENFILRCEPNAPKREGGGYPF
jgi:hypothetical protein